MRIASFASILLLYTRGGSIAVVVSTTCCGCDSSPLHVCLVLSQALLQNTRLRTAGIQRRHVLTDGAVVAPMVWLRDYLCRRHGLQHRSIIAERSMRSWHNRYAARLSVRVRQGKGEEVVSCRNSEILLTIYRITHRRGMNLLTDIEMPQRSAA